MYFNTGCAPAKHYKKRWLVQGVWTKVNNYQSLLVHTTITSIINYQLSINSWWQWTRDKKWSDPWITSAKQSMVVCHPLPFSPLTLPISNYNWSEPSVWPESLMLVCNCGKSYAHGMSAMLRARMLIVDSRINDRRYHSRTAGYSRPEVTYWWSLDHVKLQHFNCEL